MQGRTRFASTEKSFCLIFEAATLSPRGKWEKQRRFAPEFYDSGFRIKSGMTRFLVFRRAWALASPGGIRFFVLQRAAPERLQGE
jgi:hypothetical protein